MNGFDSIADYIPLGRENAITAKELQTITGIKLRDITRSIQRERLSGVPICANSDSTNPGYYLANDPKEIQRYIKSLDHREREIRKTREALQKAQNGLRNGLRKHRY